MVVYQSQYHNFLMMHYNVYISDKSFIPISLIFSSEFSICNRIGLLKVDTGILPILLHIVIVMPKEVNLDLISHIETSFGTLPLFVCGRDQTEHP